MERYRHTQVGYLLIIIYAVVMLVFTALKVGTHEEPIYRIAMLVVALVLVIFATLTVAVDDRRVRVFFTFGLIRRTIALRDIEAAQVVRHQWYYGWGIRLTPSGWFFGVSGLNAVELKLHNGKSFRIGTDDPHGLADAINRAISAPELF